VNVFVCERCNRRSRTGEKPVRQVVATRRKAYISGGKATDGSEMVKEVLRHRVRPGQ
jgi:hypothetical protein